MKRAKPAALLPRRLTNPPSRGLYASVPRNRSRRFVGSVGGEGLAAPGRLSGRNLPGAFKNSNFTFCPLQIMGASSLMP